MDSQFEQLSSVPLAGSKTLTEYYRKKIQIRDALKRLMNNPDWDLVINQDFRLRFVSEMVQFATVYGFENENKRDKFMRLAEAPGCLVQYIETIFTEAQTAEENLNDNSVDTDQNLQ